MKKINGIEVYSKEDILKKYFRTTAQKKSLEVARFEEEKEIKRMKGLLKYRKRNIKYRKIKIIL